MMNPQTQHNTTVNQEVSNHEALDQEVIKVFVGCDPNNCDLEQMMVLDYSIHKHTTQPVEIVWMQISRDPNSFWYSNPETGEGWNTSKWATPFSGFRWAIPAYCGYKGRAIYMDADMVVLSDLAELWQHPLSPEAAVAAKGEDDIVRLCTCLWDNAKAQAILPDISELRTNPDSHSMMMAKIKAHPELVERYTDSFNCVDGENLPIEQIKILHYSDMGTQFSHEFSLPRLKVEGQTHWFDGKIMPHPRPELTELFRQYYQEAIQAGYHIDNYRVAAFGNFPKKSQKKYQGNAITRPVKEKSFFQKLFNR